MTDMITITGNLAAEPEQRTISPGVLVTNFRVGSTHRRFDKSSEQWVDAYTSWYAVSAYRSLGEHAFESLHKGDRVIVSGRLRVREWDSGAKRGLAVEIDADAVGHDLLRGVSTFRKAGAPEAPPREEEATPAVEAAAAATDQAGWTLPAAPAELADTPF